MLDEQIVVCLTFVTGKLDNNDTLRFSQVWQIYLELDTAMTTTLLRHCIQWSFRRCFPQSPTQTQLSPRTHYIISYHIIPYHI